MRCFLQQGGCFFENRGMVPHSVMVTGIICGIFKVFMDLPMADLHPDVAFCLQKTGFRPHLGLFRTADEKCDSRPPTNNSSISQAREPSRDLCFDLHVNYDGLPGEGTRNKARELVAYCKRRERIPELVKAIVERRPNISWASVTRRPTPP